MNLLIRPYFLDPFICMLVLIMLMTIAVLILFVTALSDSRKNIHDSLKDRECELKEQKWLMMR